MFRLRNFNNTTLGAAITLARVALILAFTTALGFSTIASAQSGGEPQVKPLSSGPVAKVQPGQCTGNNTIRYFFLYTNGQIDSGVSTSQEITADNSNCYQFRDGDTDLDAAQLHLSCSEDYTADPTAAGNGLTVEHWALYRLSTNGGVCGDIPFPGRLVISKVTDPSGAPDTFDFSGSGGIGNFSLQDGDSEEFFVDPDTYTVEESPLSGWTLTNIECVDEGTADSSVDVPNATASPTLGRDETVTCTFTNTEIQGSPAVTIEKATNGEDADTAPGPTIIVGNPVNWTYVVTNTGDVALMSLSVTDDQGVTVSCPKTTLAIGETMTCTASGTATPGQYANLGSVQGTDGETTVTDTDPSHYFGEESPTFDLSIVKSDGGQVLVAEGGIVVYTLSYQNTGNVDLTGVTITEHVPTYTTFSAADSTNGWSCSNGAPAATACTFNVGAVAAGGSGQVLFGLKVDEIWFPDPQTGLCPANPGPLVVDNTASIVDDGNNGDDSNTSNNQDSDDTPISLECENLLQTPSIVITKNPASQLVQQGDPADFTITVTNNGDVALTNVTVTDPLSPDCNHNIGDLAIGASATYTCSRPNVQAGFTNVATACGDVSGGGNVCDDDDARVRVVTEEEPPQSIPIPTLSQWALILMAGLVLLLGGRRVKEWMRR